LGAWDRELPRQREGRVPAAGRRAEARAEEGGALARFHVVVRYQPPVLILDTLGSRQHTRRLPRPRRVHRKWGKGSTVAERDAQDMLAQALITNDGEVIQRLRLSAAEAA